MTDRHPPQDYLLDRIKHTNVVLVTSSVTSSMVEEARATKCEHLRMQDALLILIFERWERGIINTSQRDTLVKRLYE